MSEQIATAVTIESLQKLLREARWYVFQADVPHQRSYDEQQSLLKRIDETLPPPPESVDACEKDLNCFQANGHEGECDAIG